MKNRLLRNIKKFLFEFIIVTLGILTAFNINKWDENNKLQTEEMEAYKSLKRDLKSDLFILNYYKDGHVKGKNYLKPILENNLKSVDSLEYYMHLFYNLQEGDATYINLKYSGKLGILKNDEIKRQISLYYETYYQGLENLAETHKKLIYDRTQPYLIKNFKYQADSTDLKSYLKEDEFLKLIEYQYATLESNLNIFDKSENLITSTLKSINTELGIEEKKSN